MRGLEYLVLLPFGALQAPLRSMPIRMLAAPGRTGLVDGWPAQPRSVDGSADNWIVRYCYEGGTLRRDGRLLPLSAHHRSSKCTGGAVIDALQEDGADLERFEPRCYDPDGGGWGRLMRDTSFSCEPDENPSRNRIDVQLFKIQPEAGWCASGGSVPVPADSGEGFFTIGVVGLKNSHNLGTLWRSAFQSGAASLFVVGERYSAQTSDTVKAWRHVPVVSHPDWNAFAAASPYGAVWVAVEMGGEPLETFEHPERACYILGSEDTGVPDSVLRSCHRVVSLPSVRYESFNVAVAGSIVMYDRMAKQRRNGQSRE